MRYLEVEQAISTLVDAGLAAPGDVAGCREEDIVVVECRVGRRLPGAYRRFLELAGRGAGEFWRNSDVFYPNMLELNAAAAELAGECMVEWKADPDTFVFWMHEGYQFMSFRLGGSDDPEVEFRSEGAWEPRGMGSFSSMLETTVSCAVEMQREVIARNAELPGARGVRGPSRGSFRR